MTQLPSWTFLWLLYPKNHNPWADNLALKPTMEAFTNVLHQTGINTANCRPGQHIIINDMEHDINQAVYNFTSNPNPPMLILVILPAADTPIYNRVKQICDVEKGLLNVCVIANKFAKPNNSQYFANMALKVNLKLPQLKWELRIPVLSLARPSHSLVSPTRSPAGWAQESRTHLSPVPKSARGVLVPRNPRFHGVNCTSIHSKSRMRAPLAYASILDPSTTGMQLHPDGFSASFDISDFEPEANSTLAARISTCSEQIHFHYWAAVGHDGTALSHKQLRGMVSQAISRSYGDNYIFACYELTNSGKWDGWLRICFNKNKSQIGCGVCGGHNN